jgi:hypothetical protein
MGFRKSLQDLFDLKNLTLAFMIFDDIIPNNDQLFCQYYVGYSDYEVANYNHHSYIIPSLAINIVLKKNIFF